MCPFRVLYSPRQLVTHRAVNGDTLSCFPWYLRVVPSASSYRVFYRLRASTNYKLIFVYVLLFLLATAGARWRNVWCNNPGILSNKGLRLRCRLCVAALRDLSKCYGWLIRWLGWRLTSTKHVANFIFEGPVRTYCWNYPIFPCEGYVFAVASSYATKRSSDSL